MRYDSWVREDPIERRRKGTSARLAQASRRQAVATDGHDQQRLGRLEPLGAAPKRAREQGEGSRQHERCGGVSQAEHL
eukprot:3036556-Prymnesium_polylepis.1